MKSVDNESPERAAYRKKCKHYALASGQCYKYSGTSGGWHWNIRCHGNCDRMKNYDKKQDSPYTIK